MTFKVDHCPAVDMQIRYNTLDPAANEYIIDLKNAPRRTQKIGDCERLIPILTIKRDDDRIFLLNFENAAFHHLEIAYKVLTYVMQSHSGPYGKINTLFCECICPTLLTVDQDYKTFHPKSHRLRDSPWRNFGCSVGD